MSKTAIKPCPFDSALLNHRVKVGEFREFNQPSEWMVFCFGCGSSSPSNKTREGAIAFWNEVICSVANVDDEKMPSKTSQWKPMIEAPEEGYVLLFLKKKMLGTNIHVGHIHPKGGWISGRMRYDAPKPLFWQPLPEQPLPKQPEEQQQPLKATQL